MNFTAPISSKPCVLSPLSAPLTICHADHSILYIDVDTPRWRCTLPLLPVFSICSPLGSLTSFALRLFPQKGVSIIWPIVSTLWGFTLGMSLFFMDDIYLFTLSLEQHHTTSLQSLGKALSGWIEQHPDIHQVSKVKNELSAPVENFYERELRFGTKAMQSKDKVQDPVTNASLKVPSNTPSTKDTPEHFQLHKEEVHTPLPSKVLMMGGSSMKTAMGSLLQSQFRQRGVESIREAQMGQDCRAQML